MFANFFFRIPHPFLSKCMLRMRKRMKIEPGPIFFFDGRKFRRQCANVIDNVRSYLFFNVQKFQTKISDSVCNDL